MDTPQMSLERFYLIVGDLGHTQKFASYILTRGLHEKKGEKTKLVHRALNLSMIVSYCRPFARNREYTQKETVDSPIYILHIESLGTNALRYTRNLSTNGTIFTLIRQPANASLFGSRKAGMLFNSMCLCR